MRCATLHPPWIYYLLRIVGVGVVGGHVLRWEARVCAAGSTWCDDLVSLLIQGDVDSLVLALLWHMSFIPDVAESAWTSCCLVELVLLSVGWEEVLPCLPHLLILRWRWSLIYGSVVIRVERWSLAALLHLLRIVRHEIILHLVIIWWSFCNIDRLMLVIALLLDWFLDESVRGHYSCNLHVAHANIAISFDCVSSAGLRLARSIVVVDSASSAVVRCNWSLLGSSAWGALEVSAQYWQHLILVAIRPFSLIWMCNSSVSLILEIIIDISITIWRRYQLRSVISWETPLSLVTFMRGRFGHWYSANVLVQGARLQRWNETALLLGSDGWFSWCTCVRGVHISYWTLVLLNNDNGCVSLMISFIVYYDLSTRRIPMRRASDIWHEIILIWWSLLLILHSCIDWPDIAAWNINLLSAYRRFKNRVPDFVIDRIISTHINSPFLWIIEILGRVIHVVYSWYFAIDIALKFIVKAATSWSCSRVRGCLALSLDRFDDFPCLLVYSTERINLTILAVLHVGVILPGLMPILNLWRHHLLPGWRMLHVMWLLYLWCDVHLSIYNYWRSMCAHFCRLFSSLSSRCSLSAVSRNRCLWLYRVHLPSRFDGWRENSFPLWLRSVHQRLLYLLLLCGSSILSRISCRFLCLLLILLAKHLPELILVLLPEYTSSFLPLGYQIIARGQVVKSVLQEVFLTFLDVDLIVSIQEFQNVLLYWYGIFADDSSCFFFWFYLLVPWVVSDVFDCESFRRVWVQDWLDQILSLFTQKTWKFVISFQNLLVQFLRILIFKGQISANHGIQYDSWAPYISAKSKISFSFDHFWSSIARTSTRSFESFAMFI